MMDDLFLEIFDDNVDVYSFDVFDTVLTRRTVCPIGVFSLIQTELYKNPRNNESVPDDLVNNFVFYRKEAEIVANSHKKHSEITLEEIYRVLANTFYLSESNLKYLIDLEIEIEKNVLFPIDDMVNAIIKLKSLGKKVIFISDMYLSADVIAECLQKVVPDFTKNSLYVSSEYKKRKSNGELFKFVKKEENIEYTNWKHIGDNKHSDYIQPKKLGMKAYHYKRYSEWHIYKFFENNFLNMRNINIFGGISRSLESKNVSIQYKTGTRIGAPIAIMYAEWILQQCAIRGIKKLYFMARDGYFLKIIIDAIIEYCGLNICTKYVFASRELFNTEDKNQIKLLKKYFINELEMDKNSGECAFIDLFGTGSSLDSLCNTLEVQELINCFLLRSDLNNKVNVNKIVMALTVDVWDNIELFFKAPHGQCEKLVDSDGIISAQYNEVETLQLLEYGIEDYADSIRDYVNAYLPVRDFYLKDGFDIDSLEMYIKIINEFPDKDLRTFLVQFPRIDKRRNKFSRWVKEKELQIKKLKYFFKVLEKNKVIHLIR